MSILPPNSTEAEIAVEAALRGEIAEIPVILADLWSADRCPTQFLPWLAHALSVDEWDSGWPEAIQRDVIRASVSVHRRKGTVGAVRDAIRAFGFSEAEIIEDHPDDHWAEYRVILSRPISVTRSAVLRRVLDQIAPARCQLAFLIFDAAYLYDDTIVYDGTFNHGAA